MPHELISHADGTTSTREYTAEEATAWNAARLANERAGMKVSRLQAKIAMMQAGVLSAVEAAVAAADPAVQMAWADAIEFRRFSPTILALSAQLGMTDTQLDDLFRAAALVDL